MQGIFVNDGQRWRRPRSKAEIRRILAQDEGHIEVEATSLHGNEAEGNLATLVSRAKLAAWPIDITFVGPDPYTKRTFYGRIVIGPDGKVRVS